MADKPSRAVVVYGDGFASLVAQSHTNLHALASLGSCGFLALRAPPSSPSSECQPSRDIRELAQLLDAYDSFDALNKELGEIDSNLQLQKRFMGLRAALFTAGTSIGSFARKVGFSVFEVDELIKKSTSPVEYSMASELLNLLGFSGGKVSEKNDFDLVFLHIKAGQQLKALKDKITINAGVDWLDKFIGELLGISPPGSEIAARLHVSLVLSYGDASENEDQKASISMLPIEESSDLSLLRPCQSYTMKGGKPLNDIRHHHPMLVAQWQEAVTRRDATKEFSHKEFQEARYLAILADRFLHEVAFKLWKAPKYGA
ncbi:hypothetical protein Taro_049894 [Colocasia esculenta]|uniref:Uncharacterized protein n=1 Tax=Colocasia esculenta TaxID=4460 RepID=A0A843XCB5_COLES|nr:hypothetical protein [Colocasia esculenta]